MIIQREVSIAANTTVENVISGSTFEFPQSNVIVSEGVTQVATGLFVTILAGGSVVLEESQPAISADFPLIPDEFYYNYAARAGERLVTRVRNSTGGAIVVRAVLMIQAVR